MRIKIPYQILQNMKMTQESLRQIKEYLQANSEKNGNGETFCIVNDIHTMLGSLIEHRLEGMQEITQPKSWVTRTAKRIPITLGNIE